jgi:hypothetical protein
MDSRRSWKTGRSSVAFKDMQPGVKVLAGLGVFALLLALRSNGDPEDDAWNADAAAVSSAPDDQGDPATLAGDDWSVTSPEDGGALPACDGTAPFAVEDGTIRLPVHGPVVPFASAACQLAEGDGGGEEAVRLVQVALTACNGQGVTADGSYGAETRRAVASVQAAHGIGADGIYGPDTRAAMTWPVVSGEGDGADGAVACSAAPGSD